MNKLEMAENFAYNLEQLRYKLGYSQDKMAKVLDISPSTYRRIINLETTKVDVYTSMIIYELSHKLAFQMCGYDYKKDIRLKVIDEITDLNEYALNDIYHFIQYRKQLQFNEKDDYRVTYYHPMGSLEDGMIFNTLGYTSLDISHLPSKVKQQVDCAIEVTTNHLFPTYHINDILLVCQRPPKDQDIGIFIHKKTMRMYIRRFVMESPRKLVPVCDFGRVIEVDQNSSEEMDEWIKFGVVVSKMY